MSLNSLLNLDRLLHFANDSDVDYVRFDYAEDGTIECMEITYKSGETAVIVRKSNDWGFADGGPPYDAATATGMYDY